ncbi:hypothetical protein GCM10023094_34710 [Rhodococcus olei]|uniref:HTH luxR-type domain-containing protein n=1 Tax=Rhodococcus olei TaxID=2161675 RepID=A0ABP8P7V0_9NOCA
MRRPYALTGTETEVAVQTAQGDGLKLIAERLPVSITTIRTHLQHLFGPSSRTRLLPSIGPVLTRLFSAAPHGIRASEHEITSRIEGPRERMGLLHDRESVDRIHACTAQLPYPMSVTR